MKKYIIVLAVLFQFILPTIALAQPSSGTCDCNGAKTGVMGPESCLAPCIYRPGGTNNPPKGDSTTSTISLPNPLGTSDPRVLIGQIIRVILGLVGSVALLMFIYGGVLWLTSGGNPKSIEQGRTTLVYAALGLLVIFGSYAVVNYLLTTIRALSSTS